MPNISSSPSPGSSPPPASARHNGPGEYFNFDLDQCRDTATQAAFARTDRACSAAAGSLLHRVPVTLYHHPMVDPDDIASRLPTWLRIVAVGLLVVVASGAALFGYRYFTTPTTLTIATGSSDGEAVRIITAIASRLTKSNASIRLKIVDTGTAVDAAKAFAAGKVDLAAV